MRYSLVSDEALWGMVSLVRCSSVFLRQTHEHLACISLSSRARKRSEDRLGGRSRRVHLDSRPHPGERVIERIHHGRV